jgi:hypothetical protein
MSGGISTAGISGDHSHRSDKYDIFFFDDLTSHLKSTSTFSQAGANDIEIPQGSYGIPISFSIPENVLESYQGKHARIMYEVEITADMGRWKRDYHYTLPFAVTNPRMDYRIGDRYFLDKEQDKKEGQPLLEMILETKDGAGESLKFNPGEVIKGRLKMENIERSRVRKAIIELHSIEYARWDFQEPHLTTLRNK